jgi:energy-coupling factor transport system permease protein
MYWVTSGFIFRKVNSPFHRLDPRTKLLISIELFSLSLLGTSVIDLGLVLAAVLTIAASAKSLRRITRTMALSSGFAAFIFVVNIVFRQGLVSSAVYSMRFFAIISSTSLFFVTTSPDELEQTLKWFHIPRDIVFAFVTAIRFVPVLMLDALQIMDAQRSRGLELDKGNIVKRARNLIPVLVPLVVNSVIRSGELAEAMESRAYGATDRPTSLYDPMLTSTDVVAIVSSIALSLAAGYIYLTIHMPI